MTLDALNEDRKPNIQGTMPFQKVSMFYEKNPLMKESGEYIRTDANGKETTVTFYVVFTDGNSLKKSTKVQI